MKERSLKNGGKFCILQERQILVDGGAFNGARFSKGAHAFLRKNGEFLKATLNRFSKFPRLLIRQVFVRASYPLPPRLCR